MSCDQNVRVIDVFDRLLHNVGLTTTCNDSSKDDDDDSRT